MIRARFRAPARMRASRARREALGRIAVVIAKRIAAPSGPSFMWIVFDAEAQARAGNGSPQKEETT